MCKTGSILWSGSIDVDEERRRRSKIFRRIYDPKYENG
jgi:hypothetical protein